MKMKSFYLVALATCVTISVNAQTTTRIQAGFNLANITVTDNGRVDDANKLTSFQVGLVSDMHLGSALYFQPGVIFSGKGSKVQSGTAGTNGYFRQTFNPFYIEIPANLVVKAPIGTSNHFFVGAGPYLGVGVSGKTKTEGQTILGGQYKVENDIKYSNDDPSTLNQEEGTGFGIVKRFDYGLNGTAGIEGKSIVLGVNYGLGLAKLQSGSNSSENNNNKNRVFSIIVGFKL
jgi:hypothetical protein